VVAAYLVGSRGTTKHAVFLGLTVTLTHTSSVFALGLVTLYLSEIILPEQLFPWLSFLSGAGIAALGVGLLWSRTRTLLRHPRTHAEHHHHADAAVPAHAHVHATLQPHAHARMRHRTPEPDHTHGHDLGHAHAHTHPHEHTHDHGAGLHSHGGRAHSHLPPGADGTRVTWKGLLALGISGGILPCPSALVVLLTAISLHRVGYGMLLIVAFSVGLAGVLTGVGLLLVHARGLFSRLPLDSAVARFTPVLSAGVVTALGAVIAFRALAGGSTLSI
jgi:ABC-type nickel/cobalt efflux system permease component RcnA